MIETRIELDGVADTLKVLKDVDPDLRKQVVRDLKAAGRIAVGAARALVPDATPLSGWGEWRGGWNTAKARRSITVSHRATSRRGSDTIPLLTVTSGKDAGLAIWDMAGRKSRGRTAAGRRMIATLEARYGSASRALWPAVEATMPEIRRGVEDAVEAVTRTATAKMRD